MRTSTAHLNDAKFYGKYMARFSWILGVKKMRNAITRTARHFSTRVRVVWTWEIRSRLKIACRIFLLPQVPKSLQKDLQPAK